MVYVVLSVNGPSRGQGLLTYFPYIIVILLVINILVGVLFIVKQFMVNKKVGVNERKGNKIERRIWRWRGI